MIIGITGAMKSGKKTVIDYFVSKGFEKVSLSDFLVKECEHDSLKPTKKNLLKEEIKLKNQFGDWILGKIAKNFVSGKKDYILVSIKTPSEAKELKKIKNFHLINVVASPELRFKRFKSQHPRSKKYSSLNDFISKEKKDQENLNNENHNLIDIYNLCDIVLSNNYLKKEDLHTVLAKMYNDLKIKEKSKLVKKRSFFNLFNFF